MNRLAGALGTLSARERWLLLATLLVALPAALWLGMAEPLLARREQARDDLAAAEALRGWVLARRAELAVLPQAGALQPAAPVGLGGIEARLQAAGLSGGPAQLADAGEGAITLRFDGAGFDALMGWLEGVEAEAGYRLAALNAVPGDVPGTVVADLRLEPLR